MIKFEIKNMSVIERLQAMEELWNSLCHEEIEIESPEWHKDILEARRKKIVKGEAEFISLEDLKSGNYK
jgi:putative addiction module component (TIGR02574 family)